MPSSGKENTGTKDHLRFTHFPAFAQFLLENKVKEFTVRQLEVLRSLDVPLLKYFESFSDDELIERGIDGTKRLLTYFAENKAAIFIEDSIEKWLSNQIPMISRDNVRPEDITLISLMRRKVFRDFLPEYTTDVLLATYIMEEVDIFTVELDTRCFKALLSLQQGLYKQAQALAHIGNWVMDIASNKITWSDEIFHIYELEPQTDITYDLATFNHPDDKEMVKEQMRVSAETLQPHDFFYRIILKNGKEKYLHAKGEVRVDKNGKAEKFFGTLQDATEQYLLTQQVIDKNEELEKSNTELASFSYVASHDLQEPLRKIRTFIELIKSKEKLSYETGNYFDRITRATERMQNLINALLSYSRMNEIKGLFEEVDLEMILKEVKMNLSDLLEEKNVMIESTPLPKIKGVALQFQQLFSNIISNSIKYSKESTPLLIKISAAIVPAAAVPGTHTATRFYKISFIDNGIGFEQQYAEKIFEVFQRLHGKAEYEGTGIGLAICRTIARNHNGFITATGEPGKSARFDIYLPKND